MGSACSWLRVVREQAAAMVFKRLQQATRLADNRKGVAVSRRLHLRVCRTLHVSNGLEHQCVQNMNHRLSGAANRKHGLSAPVRQALSQVSRSNVAGTRWRQFASSPLAQPAGVPPCARGRRSARDGAIPLRALPARHAHCKQVRARAHVRSTAGATTLPSGTQVLTSGSSGTALR